MTAATRRRCFVVRHSFTVLRRRCHGCPYNYGPSGCDGAGTSSAASIASSIRCGVPTGLRYPPRSLQRRLCNSFVLTFLVPCWSGRLWSLREYCTCLWYLYYTYWACFAPLAAVLVETMVLQMAAVMRRAKHLPLTVCAKLGFHCVLPANTGTWKSSPDIFPGKLDERAWC